MFGRRGAQLLARSAIAIFQRVGPFVGAEPAKIHEFSRCDGGRYHSRDLRQQLDNVGE